MLIETEAAYQDSLLERQKDANIEFVLRADPTQVGEGVIDTLMLQFSRDMTCDPYDPHTGRPIREQLAEGFMGMVGVKRENYRAEIPYVPIDRLSDRTPGPHFFKAREDGKIYAAEMRDVTKAIGDLFGFIDHIINHRFALFFHLSVDRLDYFNHVTVKRQSNLYRVERQVTAPKPVFYNTNYEETHLIRHWLESIGRPKN